MDGLRFTVIVIVIVAVAVIAIGSIMARLYRRASKEVAFVRTGFGGQKVIMNGGCLVFPVMHEIIEVNMNTLRLEVRRADQQALITKDRMRADVLAEFYVRVKPTEEALADAAQTLGKKTMQPAALKELVEGKFVDALRSVAAEMAMEELHEQRVDFVQKVQKAVSEDLLKNGLELESVSLTGLDQTSKDFFNPQNAFDAQGLTHLTKEIENRRRERNDIERDTEVMISTKNLEAERKKLDIAREEEYARMEQQKEVEIRKAEQSALIAAEKSAKEKDAREAEISAERTIAERLIEKEKLLKQAEIEKQRSLEASEIERKKDIELAEQGREIAIAEKSKEQSLAKAEAARARAETVKAEEQVSTVREAEIAERQKRIELLEASKHAEKKAIEITIAAEAERKASEDKAAAIKIQAQAEADAEIIRAEAAAKSYEVEAAGKRALYEADNALSQAQIAMKIKTTLIENMAEIIRESAKPMEKIEGIRIYAVNGLGGNGSTGQDIAPEAGGSGNLAEQVVSSALKYRAQAPLVDSLLKEIGLSGADPHNLTSVLKTITETNPEPKNKA
jgi:uncharacterized membrane protein YqiK